MASNLIFWIIFSVVVFDLALKAVVSYGNPYPRLYAMLNPGTLPGLSRFSLMVVISGLVVSLWSIPIGLLLVVAALVRWLLPTGIIYTRIFAALGQEPSHVLRRLHHSVLPLSPIKRLTIQVAAGIPSVSADFRVITGKTLTLLSGVGNFMIFVTDDTLVGDSVNLESKTSRNLVFVALREIAEMHGFL